MCDMHRLVYENKCGALKLDGVFFVVVEHSGKITLATVGEKDNDGFALVFGTLCE